MPTTGLVTCWGWGRRRGLRMVAEEEKENLSTNHQNPPTIPLLHHPCPQTGPAVVAISLLQLPQGSLNGITEAGCVP